MLGRVLGSPISLYAIWLLSLVPVVEAWHQGGLMVPISDSRDDLRLLHVNGWGYFSGGRRNLRAVVVGGAVNPRG